MNSWKFFCDTVRSGRIQLSADTLANANRASARFKLASNFHGINASKISDRTLQGYSAAFSVFLAYTAAEQIGKLTGKTIKKWHIHDSAIAAKLRKQMTLMNDGINEHLNDNNLKKNIENFMKKKTDDVRVVAEVIRVAVAHGSLTSTGANATTSVNRMALFELSKKLLAEAETRFAEWVDQSVKSA